MKDYFKKYSLDNQTAFVVGGLGLIGGEVSNAITSAEAKIIVLDLDEKINGEFDSEMIGREFDLI